MRELVEEPAGRRVPHVHAALEAGHGQPRAVRSQTFTRPSEPTEARWLPWGWKATQQANRGCAFGISRITSPVLLFRTRTVPSPSAEARRSPSGANATL